MMQLLMRMKKTKWMLFCRPVIAQYQIQLVFIVFPSGNRSNGIMLLALRIGIYKGFLVGISPPASQYMLCQIGQTLPAAASKP